MSRLITSGFETQVLGAANAGEGEGFVGLGSSSIETSLHRSGAACLKATAATSGGYWLRDGTAAAAMSLDTTYYFRAYFRCGSAWPTANAAVFRCFSDAAQTTQVGSVTLLTTGKFRTLSNTNATIGTAANAIAVDAWYRVEWVLRVNSAGGSVSTSQLYVTKDSDNVGGQVLTSTTANLGSAAPRTIGCQTAAAAPGGTTVYYWDDVAMDDAALPGPGKIVLLTPTSDNAKSPTGSAGWKGGGGGTTNLYQGVDNVPPLAVAGTDATEIADSDNSSTDTYDANLATYASGGIQAADRVALTQALAQGSNGTATFRTIAVVQQSNPGSGTKGTLSVGAEPRVVRDAAQIDPTVTLGSSPVVRVSKDVATTDTLFYELVGLYVEYRVPIQVTLTPATETDAAQTLDVDKRAIVAPASESDAAQALSYAKPILKALTPVTETDAAQTFVVAKRLGVTAATETDAAQALSFTKPISKTITPAGETDAAQALGYSKPIYKSLTPVAETDQAQALTLVGNIYRTLTPAAETDEAQALSVASAAQPSPGGWIRTRRIPLKRPQVLTLSPAYEFDRAVPLGLSKAPTPRQVVTLSSVREHDHAVALEFVKTPSRIQIEDDELLLLA